MNYPFVQLKHFENKHADSFKHQVDKEHCIPNLKLLI